MCALPIHVIARATNAPAHSRAHIAVVKRDSVHGWSRAEVNVCDLAREPVDREHEMEPLAFSYEVSW